MRTVSSYAPGASHADDLTVTTTVRESRTGDGFVAA